ncbi:MAG: hypothetical protein E7369_01745 [Clostridiales bacterium]|nr:hypothetical protein [Clostridiales bacterium]
MSNLIYANARATGYSNALLGKDRLLRIVDCQTYADSLKILSEVGFGGGVYSDAEDDFESIITAEEKTFYDFLREECVPQDVATFVMLKNDFHNAEAYVKAKHLKIDVEDMTVNFGRIEKDELKEKIFSDDYSDFPKSMANALLTCDEDFVSGRATGESVNNIFTKAYYAELTEISKSNPYLKRICSFNIDCVNISVCLRLKNYGLAKEFLIPNGSFTEDELQKFCDESIETVKENFKFSDFNDVLSVIGGEDGNTLVDFERVTESYALRVIEPEKYSSESYYPIMNYCFNKVCELKNVRIALVGVINGNDKIQTKRKLRI